MLLHFLLLRLLDRYILLLLNMVACFYTSLHAATTLTAHCVQQAAVLPLLVLLVLRKMQDMHAFIIMPSGTRVQLAGLLLL